MGPIRQRFHERRHIATAQRVGQPLEIVERHVLIGQRYNKMIEQGAAQLRDILGLQRLGQVDPGHEGACRSTGLRDLYFLPGMNGGRYDSLPALVLGSLFARFGLVERVARCSRPLFSVPFIEYRPR
jgi:hypothetical protein